MTYREMKRQPRAKAMLPAIRQLIVVRALEKRSKDRTLLAHELKKEIQDKYPHEIAPTADTIIKRVSEARSHASSPIDEPWHLGILNKLHEYGILDISADGVNAILKVQHWLQEASGETLVNLYVKKKDITKLGLGAFAFMFSTLSIRQAKWISVLYTTTGTEPKYLWFVSFYYAYHEIISNISNTSFDTRNIDAWLCRGKATFLNMLKIFMPSELSIFGENFEKALDVLHYTGKSKGE